MLKTKVHLTKKQFKSDLERAVEMQCEYVLSPDLFYTGFFSPEDSKDLASEKELPFLKDAIKIGVLKYLEGMFKKFLKWRFKITKLDILDEAQVRLIASSWNEWRHKNAHDLANDIYSSVEFRFIFNG